MPSEFKKRSRSEIMAMLEAMAAEYQHAADAYKDDAVEQIRGIERGTVADVGEAIHRAVNAIAFMRLADALRDLEAMANGRRNATRWLSADRVVQR